VSDLDDLVDDFLKDRFEEWPTWATRLGVDGYDRELEDLSAEAFQRRKKKVDLWISRFEVLNEGLSPEERIDRDLALSALYGSRIFHDWKIHKRNPGTYLAPILGGVFSVFLNRLHSEKELAESAAARLGKAGDLMEAGKKNLDPQLVSPLAVQQAIGQCRAGIHYLRNLVPGEVSDEKSRALLQEACEKAASAQEDFLSFLEALESDAKGDWALGEEPYSALLKEKEALGYDAAEMLERGKAQYGELDKEMKLSKSISGVEDWRALVEELKKDHPTTPEEMRDEYARWTEKARQFLIDKDLVTLPDGEKCEVIPAPPFQRPIQAVASYTAPPAFKPSLTGHFFVPYPPDGTPEEGVQRLLEGSRMNVIPSIVVHEAYPGHHWHYITVNAKARPIRKVILTEYFEEGWALYSERVMREEGFFEDPLHEFGHVEARMIRAIRIIVDTSLHMGKMTEEDAFQFMFEKLGGSEPMLRTEVKRYCMSPTQAPSYLTGCLEIERMRKRFFNEKRGSLKEFHNRIAATGGLPLGLAEEALFK
jgi:uncharacterized protein (DUF885 family)